LASTVPAADFPFTISCLPITVSSMDIAALLDPYISSLTTSQVEQVSTYLGILLRWNAKTNLTAIRDPEQIVRRHFGESFFLARQLFPIVITSEARDPLSAFKLPAYQLTNLLSDLGSGAGFPGIPLKIAVPDLTLTLVEAHHTKAVFLREVLRALHLEAEVKNVRAETLPPGSASLVTLRAVEKFDSILPTAARLVSRSSDPVGGVHGLALLISSAQIARAREILPNWRFQPQIPIPNSENRVIQLVEPNR
jgi:16S rRNA (guanine527-N7)-methyltransferase